MNIHKDGRHLAFYEEKKSIIDTFHNTLCSRVPVTCNYLTRSVPLEII